MKNKALSMALATLALLPALAWAHTGHADHGPGGLLQGLLHPITGPDHLAAMLAVGAVAGFVGVAVPGVEPMVAASLLVLGLLLAQRRQLPLALTTVLVGAFAFFHGAAHGSELGGAGQWLALAGMLVSTALLHGTGMALGHAVVARHRWLAVLAGASTALLGAALLVRMA